MSTCKCICLCVRVIPSYLFINWRVWRTCVTGSFWTSNFVTIYNGIYQSTFLSHLTDAFCLCVRIIPSYIPDYNVTSVTNPCDGSFWTSKYVTFFDEIHQSLFSSSYLCILIVNKNNYILNIYNVTSVTNLCDGIFHDENVGDCSKLSEVFSKLLRGRLPRQPSNE